MAYSEEKENIVSIVNDINKCIQKNKKSYRLFVVHCYDAINDVKEIINDYLNEPIMYTIGNDILALCDFENDVSDLELTDIVLSIRENLDSRVKVVKCGVVNKYNSDVIIDIYKGCQYMNKRNFTLNNLSDLIFYLVDKEIEVVRNIRNKVLGRVNEDNQLIKLILSMFDNDLNVTKTASSMYMHRNTINNKLEFIKKETGFNVQCFKDAMALYILIKVV